VRVICPGQEGGIKEILLKEHGNLVTVKDEISDPELSYLWWFDWDNGIGFSPWQVINEYAPARDPLLGTVAKVFADLVTEQEKEIKKRTVTGASAVQIAVDQLPNQ